MGNAILSVASAVIKALEYDLPDIKENDRERRPNEDEIEVYSFPQTWGSTALGFGGVGGQMVTGAQTTVVVHLNNAAVYFNGYLAYVIEGFNQTFFEDLGKHDMADVRRRGKYFRQ